MSARGAGIDKGGKGKRTLTGNCFPLPNANPNHAKQQLAGQFAERAQLMLCSNSAVMDGRVKDTN